MKLSQRSTVGGGPIGADYFHFIRNTSGSTFASYKGQISDILALAGGGGGTIELSMFAGGTATASEILFRHEFTAAVTIPAALAGSQGSSGTAATGSAALSLKKNGTQFGTATWAAAGTEPTLAAASSTSFAIGDVLSITAPATPDATLADISLSIVGSV